jgi:branched-chain amino acid transport system permease protein
MRRVVAPVAAAGFVALVGLLPLVLSDFRAYEFALVGVYFIAIAGLNVLTGYTGQISLGHGAFMAVGGYTTAILAADHGFDPVWTIPIAGLVTGAIGFAFGVPALRLSGLYLALATFGVAVAAPAVFRKFSGLTGGASGKILPQPSAKFGLYLTSNDWLYYLTWTIALVLLAVAWLIVRGRTGRAFRAMRDSEVAAAASGVNLALYKTLAFGVSAFYAGVAGSLFAIAVTVVSPDTYPVTLSIFLVVGAVAAGLGSLRGLVFGALLVQFLPIDLTPKIVDLVNAVVRTNLNAKATGVPDVVFGAVLVLVMVLLPTGAAGLLGRLGEVAARLYTRPR